MLYYKHGISAVGQLLKYIYQLVYIGGMKSCCRLVKNVHSLAGRTL